MKPVDLNVSLIIKKNYSTEPNEIHKRIDKLIKNSTVVLFIKGFNQLKYIWLDGFSKLFKILRNCGTTKMWF